MITVGEIPAVMKMKSAGMWQTGSLLREKTGRAEICISHARPADTWFTKVGVVCAPVLILLPGQARGIPRFYDVTAKIPVGVLVGRGGRRPLADAQNQQK